MADTITISATMPAPLRGPAVYFDGTSSARNDVVVETGAKALRVLACRNQGQDRVLDEWPYAELRRMSAPEGVLRLGRRGETLLARLEIRAPELAAAIEDRAEALDRSGAAERQLRRKIVALSFAAAASLVVTAVFGLPALASRVIPLVPLAVEHKLGGAIDHNIRGKLDSEHLGAAFACGSRPKRNGRPRRARQARRQACGGCRAAVPPGCRGGPPRRAQRHGAAGRSCLCR